MRDDFDDDGNGLMLPSDDGKDAERAEIIEEMTSPATGGTAPGKIAQQMFREQCSMNAEDIQRWASFYLNRVWDEVAQKWEARR